MQVGKCATATWYMEQLGNNQPAMHSMHGNYLRLNEKIISRVTRPNLPDLAWALYYYSPSDMWETHFRFSL